MWKLYKYGYNCVDGLVNIETKRESGEFNYRYKLTSTNTNRDMKPTQIISTTQS